MTLLFRPMLAASKTPDLNTLTYPLYASPKLDGIRCIVADGIPFSRNMKRIPNKFVQQEIMKLQQHGLDGELMLNGDFNEVQSGIMSVTGEPDFYLNVFDNWDLKGNFHDRYIKLKGIIEDINSPRVKLLEQVLITNMLDLVRYWNKCIEEGYEGVITRLPTGPYKNGRSTVNQQYMVKLKKWHDDEGEIIGYEEMQSNTNKAITGELGQTTRSSHQENMVPCDCLGSLTVRWNGHTFNVGSGFDMAMRHKLWVVRKTLKGKKVTFKYQEVSKYGKPRFPIFKAIREEE